MLWIRLWEMNGNWAVDFMARVVVTGGCGFIGSHLVDQLIRGGDDVTVLDARSPQELHVPNPGARYVLGDVRDSDRLSEVITKEVDTVYHLAAEVGVDQYLKNPLQVIDVNFGGTQKILGAALAAEARLVFASTSEVFGKNTAVPWDESADRVLGATSTHRWSYGSSKALAEHVVFAFVKEYGLPASIVRYFNIYGPRQRPDFLVSRSVHRALRGLSPVVYDGGSQTRSFTFIDDAVAATIAIGTESVAVGESFNIGGTDEIPIRQVVDLIVEQTGLEAGVTDIDTVKSFGDTYQDLVRRVPDTAKAVSLLDWHCRIELADGIAQTIEWARSSPWWLEDSSDAVL